MTSSPQPASLQPKAVAFADMGAGIEELRQALLAAGRDMQREGEASNVPVVERVLQILQALACQVVVIGQVKAGKSSFIGALVGRPHLLPSDANPWTTVVTQLHFENRSPPTEKVDFTFFTSDEWTRIAEGGGPLRELTERLVPGFDLGLLRAQLQAMRRRAERRLGQDFASILGQSHSFPKVDRDVLARYVSAGPDGVDLESGWYSDVTKTASLYIGCKRTGLPVTIVDTPGTNDPMLVRDEITRLNVSAGDVFVVMLTAQQPLSTADLALLRLLRGLHKDRIVIFLNRIDGLPDAATDIGRIVRHVEDRLHDEFPSIRFPIIVGSAAWANIALAGADREVEAALGPTLQAYAATRGIAVPTVTDGQVSADVRSALFSLSGIPEVTATISRLMQRGAAAHVLRQHAQLLFHLAQSSEVTERGHTKALHRALRETRAGAEAQSGQLYAWRTELDQIEEAGRQLQENLAFYERTLGAIVDRCGNDLRQLLGNCVTRFLEQEVDDLNRNYHDRRAEVWRCDPTTLRKDLQNEFLRIFGYWEGMLQQVDQQIMTQLQLLMPNFSMADDGAVLEAAVSPLMQSPDYTTLGRTLAFDLSAPWWKSWWSGQPTIADMSDRLQRLLRGEFEPLVEDLIGSAIGTMRERSQLASRQARLCTLDIVEGIHRRSAELVASLQNANDGAAPSTVVARLDGELRAAEASAARWSERRGHLSRLVARCQSMLEDTGAA